MNYINTYHLVRFYNVFMKEKAILANLSKLMVRLIHNVSQFNSQVLTTTQSLKRNHFSSTPCSGTKFHDYITLKQSKSEEDMVVKPGYITICARYSYKALLDKNEWEVPNAQEEKTSVLSAELNPLKT